MHRKTIDPVTGRMFLKHSLMDDMRERHKRVYDSYQRKYSDVEGAKEFEENNRFKITKAEDRVIREMSIDVDKMYPNRRQKEWLAAQAYIVGKDDLIDPYHPDDVDLEEGQLMVNRIERDMASKAAYDNTKEAIT